MLDWFTYVVTGGSTIDSSLPDSVVSGACLATLAVLIFILWSLTRLFRR